MPRATAKNVIIDLIYFEGCVQLLDLNTSDESEADEIELNTLQDLNLVLSNRSFVNISHIIFTFVRLKNSDMVTSFQYQCRQFG